VRPFYQNRASGALASIAGMSEIARMTERPF